MATFFLVLLFTVIHQSLSAEVICPDESVCLYVINNCGEKLYLQRSIIDGYDENNPTRVQELDSGAYGVVLNVTEWPQGTPSQLYAWWQDPTDMDTIPSNILTTGREKVEITLNSYSISYGITAIDYFGLPYSISPYNINDCPSQISSSIDINIDDISLECPTEYIYTHPFGVCNSPASTCVAESSNGICSELDETIQECIADGICEQSVTSLEIWNCAGLNVPNNNICAAIHRGIYDSDDPTDVSTFYKTSPYNRYAAWIHSFADVYAFPTDNQGVDRTCDTNFLKIEFCSAGSDDDDDDDVNIIDSLFADITSTAAESGDDEDKGDNTEDDDTGISDMDIVIIAAVCGLVLIPLLFGLIFYCSKGSGNQQRVNDNQDDENDDDTALLSDQQN